MSLLILPHYKAGSKEYKRIWHSLHKTYENTKANQWYRKHREYHIIYQKQWRNKNLEKVKQQNRERLLNRRKRVLNHYSGNNPMCRLCKINVLEVLVIDHINGNGNEERKKLNNRGGEGFYKWLINSGFPLGYRVLCWNCNYLEYLRLVKERSA